MAKIDLISLFEQNHQMQAWQEGFTKDSRQLILGLSASSKALAIASLLRTKQAKIVVVVASVVEAERLESDLVALVGEEQVYPFIAEDVAAVELAFASKEREYARAQSLQFLQENQSGILIANLAALGLRLPNPKDYAAYKMTLELGQTYAFDDLLQVVTDMGYRKVGQVSQAGEYSRRGDILDIYPLGQDFPYRLEFFGDELDSLRIFSPDHQRSQQQVDSLTLQPVVDQILSQADYDRAEAALIELMESQSNPSLLSYLQEILAAVRNYSNNDAYP